jgi:hypothetical protein
VVTAVAGTAAAVTAVEDIMAEEGITVVAGTAVVGIVAVEDITAEGTAAAARIEEEDTPAADPGAAATMAAIAVEPPAGSLAPIQEEALRGKWPVSGAPMPEASRHGMAWRGRRLVAVWSPAVVSQRAPQIAESALPPGQVRFPPATA